MSKLTVTLPDDLHAQIRQELEEQGITTGQFIEMVVTKYFTKDKKGATDMATRTIAFQVSEELYQRIKDYLKHYEETYGRKLSQKDFMVQLIEAELDAVDEEAEAAAAQKQDPSAEMNDMGAARWQRCSPSGAVSASRKARLCSRCGPSSSAR